MVVETYIYMGAICPGEMSDFTLNMVDIRNKTFFFWSYALEILVLQWNSVYTD